MSVDLRANLDIEDLCVSLGAAIEELPEYRAFKEAQSAVKASDRAQERIEAIEQERHDFMLARQLGEATTEDAEELRAMQRDLHTMPVMEAYLESKETLDRRLTELNEAISGELSIDFANAAGSCCHD